GVPGIQSFTVNNIDVVDFPKQPLLVRRESRVHLECTVNVHATKNFTLRIRNLSGKVLVESFNTKTVKYAIEDFQCRHLGTYICEVGYASDQVTSATTDLATESCPPVLFSEHESGKTVVSPISSNQTVTFSVLAYITIQPTIFIQNTTLRNGGFSDKYGFQMVTNTNSSVLLTMVISISNVSASDYGRLNVQLYTGSDTLFNVHFIIKPEGKSSDVKFISLKHKDEPGVTLNCSAVGYPQSVVIGRRYYKETMSTYSSKGLIHIINLLHISIDVGCSFMATYVCNVTTFEGLIVSELLDVTMEDCNPSLCDHQRNNQTTLLNTGETAVISFCVVAHPTLSNIADVKLFHSSKCSGHTNCPIPLYSVDIGQTDSKMYSNITLKISNITSQDFGCYDVTIRKAKNFVFNFCLFQLKESGHLVVCDGFQLHTTVSADLKANVTVHLCVNSNIDLGTHIGIDKEAYLFQNSNPGLGTSRPDTENNDTMVIDELHKQDSPRACGKPQRDTSDYLTVSFERKKFNYFIDINLFHLNETDFRAYKVKLRPNLTVELNLMFAVLLAKKPPTLCKGQDSEIIFAQMNDDVTADFCIEATTRLDENVNINGVTFQPGSVHNKIDVSLVDGTWPKVILKITIKNVTSLDFKMYDVTLSSAGVKQRRQLSFVLIERTFIKDEPTQSYFIANGVQIQTSLETRITLTKGRPGFLECAIKPGLGYFNKTVTILDEKDGVLNTTKDNPVQVYFPSLACDNAGVYYCVVDDVDSQSVGNISMTLVVSNCFYVICPHDSNRKTVSAMLGETISISFCVSFLYDKRILPNVIYNSTSRFRNQPEYSYDWVFNGVHGHENNLSLTIYNITKDYIDEHDFIVTTTNADSLNLKIDIVIMDLNNKTGRLTSPKMIKSNSMFWIAIPVAFVLIIIA
ncbi:unnamed protein product, partial [Lymnaea stagnalis]